MEGKEQTFFRPVHNNRVNLEPGVESELGIKGGTFRHTKKGTLPTVDILMALEDLEAFLKREAKGETVCVFVSDKTLVWPMLLSLYKYMFSRRWQRFLDQVKWVCDLKSALEASDGHRHLWKHASGNVNHICNELLCDYKEDESLSSDLVARAIQSCVLKCQGPKKALLMKDPTCNSDFGTGKGYPELESKFRGLKGGVYSTMFGVGAFAASCDK